MDSNKTLTAMGSRWVLRALVVALLDVVLISASFFAALLIRFDLKYSEIDEQFIESYLKIVPLCIAGAVLLFILFRAVRLLKAKVGIPGISP